jgi:5'-nucleotidase
MSQEFSQTEKLRILDEIPSIQAEARKLKASGVKIIILLSHSEFKDDKEFAEAIPELSLIVGSHSHTFMYTPVGK